ncbi:DUF2958 domain-containing protein [Stenotrophomonas oahuensis]|uniref:DUF2958 domain-containing protein n=1 Tax=Stenotrophomonas oahuensis TaxID=3003271 RepID=A0ABY9YV14_9GAMM|nr:DUF2958 domain-containing protein [Stenotrophomonas sp. A5586]WNH54829.1 DUF2958 domain-containing protein [Stenotrophomonas sp. A5586]
MPAINLAALRNFIPAGELAVIRSCVAGEEGAYFRAKLIEFSERVQTMPKIYEQHGLGTAAVAHLRYFRGDSAWYVIERDTSNEQLQAFGMAALGGYEPELGYINLAELIAAGVELDLHFSPTRLDALEALAA